MTSSSLAMVFADDKGTVFDAPDRQPLFRSGRAWMPVRDRDLIPLPEGSYLYFLPGRQPVWRDSASGRVRAMPRTPGGGPAQAVSAFLSSGYLRTALPAFRPRKDAPPLPLWAYSGVVCRDGQFMVPALRIDDDPRSDPAQHRDVNKLARAIRRMTKKYPENRLVRQLAGCGTDYGCLCARNFFLERHETPLPTTPACNAACLGCLSHQQANAGFVAAQPRIRFKPTPAEIAQVMAHHFARVENAVASFGQGCEGEPLLRTDDLARAIRLVREKTDRGTINLNTNGSLPAGVHLLANAGLDSIRISLNSPTTRYYQRYSRPKGYGFADVLASIETALDAGLFVALNLFFMPGFTDMESETDSLFALLDRYPVSMIQTRNLNMDPDLYFETIGYRASRALGIPALLAALRRRYPKLRLGYYNPAKETFRR